MSMTKVLLDTIKGSSINDSDSISSIKNAIIQIAHLDSTNTVSNSINTVAVTKDKLLGIDSDLAKILIPVAVTLTVFLIGQFISWLKTKKERLSELNSVKVTLEYWITAVEPSITTQKTGCMNFVNALGSSTDISPEKYQFTPMLVNKLQQIGLKELIETIMVNLKGDENKKAKIVFNIISQVEFLTQMEVQIKSNYERFYAYTFELMEDWNNTFKKFNKEMNETSSKIYSLNPRHIFVINKDRVCNTFLQHREVQPLETIFTELIIPLETEVISYLRTQPHKELVTDFGYTIEELKIIKKKWDVHKAGHIQLNTEYSERISTVYEVLKEAGKELKQLKFMNIMLIK
jgi:hypothetical protein